MNFKKEILILVIIMKTIIHTKVKITIVVLEFGIVYEPASNFGIAILPSFFLILIMLDSICQTTRERT